MTERNIKIVHDCQPDEARAEGGVRKPAAATGRSRRAELPRHAQDRVDAIARDMRSECRADLPAPWRAVLVDEASALVATCERFLASVASHGAVTSKGRPRQAYVRYLELQARLEHVLGILGWYHRRRADRPAPSDYPRTAAEAMAAPPFADENGSSNVDSALPVPNMGPASQTEQLPKDNTFSEE